MVLTSAPVRPHMLACCHDQMATEREICSRFWMGLVPGSLTANSYYVHCPNAHLPAGGRRDQSVSDVAIAARTKGSHDLTDWDPERRLPMGRLLVQ
jgi:hypothetical protein